MRTDRLNETFDIHTDISRLRSMIEQTRDPMAISSACSLLQSLGHDGKAARRLVRNAIDQGVLRTDSNFRLVVPDEVIPLT